MFLAVLKYGGSWDVLANVFKMKAPTFERLILGFIRAASPVLSGICVTPISQSYSMEGLREENTMFKNFPVAIEAIDITFQQASSPSGNMLEGKRYFSGKHKLYGYKIEVAVRPNGLASAFSAHRPGSVSDIAIMTQRVEEHTFRAEKFGADKDIDDGEDSDGEASTHRGILADKGYQGANEILR